MGCWNETCGLSSLPIRAGDEIALIALYGSGELGYSPMCVPIYGEYDDYGGIKNIQNQLTVNLLFNEMNRLIGTGKLYIPMSEDEPSEWDKEKHFKSSKDMLDCITQGYIEGKNRSYRDDVEYDICHVTCMMIHKRILDAIISEYGERKPYNCGDELRTCWSEIIERDRTKYLEVMSESSDDEEEIDENNETYQRLKDLEPSDAIIEMMNILTEISDETIPEETRAALSKGLSAARSGTDKIFFLKWEFKEMCRKMFHDISDFDMSYIMREYFDNGQEWLKEAMIGHVMTKYVFSRARIKWAPTVGRGSQSEEYGIIYVINEQSYKIIQERVNQIIDDSKEDGEDLSFTEAMRQEYISDPRKY